MSIKRNVECLLVPIVTACDQAFLPGLHALLYSISHHCTKRMVYVLDCGIFKADREELLKLYPSLKFIRTPQILGLPMPSVGSYATYARLQIGEIFQEQEQVLYLDADTLVLTDLCELDALTLQPGKIIAACIEPYTPTFDSPNGVIDHQKLGIKGIMPYFNAGVMLIDVQRWNKAGVMDQAVDYLRRLDLRITLFDQEALNVALVNRWQTLIPEWNVSRYWMRVERRANRPRILEDARIVHFLSTEKPWLDPAGVDSWLLKKFKEYSIKPPGH